MLRLCCGVRVAFDIADNLARSPRVADAPVKSHACTGTMLARVHRKCLESVAMRPCPADIVGSMGFATIVAVGFGLARRRELEVKRDHLFRVAVVGVDCAGHRLAVVCGPPWGCARHLSTCDVVSKAERKAHVVSSAALI